MVGFGVRGLEGSVLQAYLHGKTGQNRQATLVLRV